MKSVLGWLAVLVIVCVIGIQVDKYLHPEKYDDSYSLDISKIEDNHLTAKILFLKKYSQKNNKDYYVYTEHGKIEISASSEYGVFFGDSSLYSELESEIEANKNNNADLNCSFKVKKSFGTFKIRKIETCFII